jgi:hypothetical protein
MYCRALVIAGGCAQVKGNSIILTTAQKHWGLPEKNM